jgi:NTE family protein
MLKSKGKRLGLALGGGGARGISHIGVLRVLEQENISIDLLVGTSIGALVGAAYASGMTADQIEEKFDTYLASPRFQASALYALAGVNESDKSGIGNRIQSFFKDRIHFIQAMFRPGILDNNSLKEAIDFFVPDIEIEKTNVLFRAVATDLSTGNEVIFSTGSLRHAVMASCAVPGIIEPVRVGEKVLVDGGVICLVPISVARRAGADIVIAVVVDRDIYSVEEFQNVFSIYFRASQIMSHRLKNHELMDADVVIQPAVGDLHWAGFSEAKGLVAEGEKAAKKHIKEIYNAVPGAKRWFSFKEIVKSYIKP